MKTHRALAVIPARAASKGIPRKNARLFLGRPLVAWTIDSALASGALERILVSTDDPEIAALGREAGIDVVERPPDLAGDDVPTAPVVKHAVETVGDGSELVLVLEPTSPARRPWHISEAADLLASSGADSVASVSQVPHHYVPEKQLLLAEDGSISASDGGSIAAMPHVRQKARTTYAFDGLIFSCRRELLAGEAPTVWGRRVVAYRVDPRYAFDLDAPEDWAPAEARMRDILDEEASA